MTDAFFVIWRDQARWKLLQEASPHPFTLPLILKRGHRLAVHKDMSHPGKWRVTIVDSDDVPYSHTTTDDYGAAVKLAYFYGGKVPDAWYEWVPLPEANEQRPKYDERVREMAKTRTR